MWMEIDFRSARREMLTAMMEISCRREKYRIGASCVSFTTCQHIVNGAKSFSRAFFCLFGRLPRNCILSLRRSYQLQFFLCTFIIVGMSNDVEGELCRTWIWLLSEATCSLCWYLISSRSFVSNGKSFLKEQISMKKLISDWSQWTSIGRRKMMRKKIGVHVDVLEDGGTKFLELESWSELKKLFDPINIFHCFHDFLSDLLQATSVVILDIVFHDTEHSLRFKNSKKTFHIYLILYLTSIRLKPFWLKLSYLASLNRFLCHSAEIKTFFNNAFQKDLERVIFWLQQRAIQFFPQSFHVCERFNSFTEMLHISRSFRKT